MVLAQTLTLLVVRSEPLQSHNVVIDYERSVCLVKLTKKNSCCPKGVTEPQDKNVCRNTAVICTGMDMLAASSYYVPALAPMFFKLVHCC